MNSLAVRSFPLKWSVGVSEPLRASRMEAIDSEVKNVSMGIRWCCPFWLCMTMVFMGW